MSALAPLLSLPVTFALAQAPSGQGTAEDFNWGLGIGVSSAQKPYTGMDRENRALPILQFENRYVRVFGPGIEVKLPGLRLGADQSIDFGLVGKYDGSGYEAGDAPILAGMAERKGGFWVGAKAKWRNPMADLNVEFLGDASGHSKGRQFALGLDRTWRLGGNVLITPRIAAKWQDAKYVDYYYGVRNAEAAAGRPGYVGEAGVNAELGLRALYRFDAHHSVLLDTSVTRLAKEIKNSPLVDRSKENRVTVGYLYRF